MENYLINHARRNVWCVPYQDRQSILNLSRISVDGGDSGVITALWAEIPLPTKKDFYHVYQIGQNHVDQLSLPATKQQWIGLQQWGEDNFQVIDLYLENGKHLPLATAYIYRQDDLNYLIAVLNLPVKWTYPFKTVGNLNTEKLYLRLYRNSLFSTDRMGDFYDGVAYGGGLIRGVADIQRIKMEVTDYRLRDGIVNIYHNGVWVDDIYSSLIKSGDFVEYVFDGTVIRVVDFTVFDLLDYESDLDSLRKYLLHPSKNPLTAESIRYRDDVDVYLYAEQSDGHLAGRYYHRNRENSLRMVTHADYSIPVSYVQAYLDGDWASLQTLHLRLHIRESSLERPLVNEAHRINELYKLSDLDIVRAMLGLDATIDEWQAPVLEKSLYTAIMRNYTDQFEFRDVLEAYGYNAITKLVDDSPLLVVTSPGGNHVDLGYGQLYASTVFEYDVNGHLLGWQHYSGSERYFTRFPECTLVEVFVGTGQKQLDWIEGNSPVTLGDYCYDFYVCNKVNGVPDLKWRKAVKDTNYTVTGGVLTWLHSATRYQGLVKSDKNFLLYDFEYSSNSGVYRFTLTHSNTLGTALTLQPEHLDLFGHNGVSLIEGLDYFVEFPEVVIVAKDRLVSGENKITVRATGFCKDDMTRTPPVDSGFAWNGYISMNGRYDIREDKVIRCIINGGVRYTPNVPYIERYGLPGLDVVANGSPYSSQAITTPIRGVHYEANNVLKDVALDLDRRLEDYLTVKNPQVVIPGPSPILELYALFSPFMTMIVWQLEQGYLTAPYKPEDPLLVAEKVKPWFDLLPFDPCRNPINTNFVRVYPTPQNVIKSVNERTFRFLVSINKLYLNEKLDISSYFSIEGTI